MTTKSTNLTELHDKIEWMDGLSQDGLSQIAAITSLLMHRLETPLGLHGAGHLIAALRVVRRQAQELMNDINVAAEQVGCHYDPRLPQPLSTNLEQRA